MSGTSLHPYSVTPIPALAVTAYTLSNALGVGREPVLSGLRRGRSALRPMDLPGVDLACHIGRVDGVETVQLPSALTGYQCRNNQLALLTWETDGFADKVAALVKRHGAGRVGLFLGTSTSGIAETERAYANLAAEGAFHPTFDYHKSHSLGALGEFIREISGIRGPGNVVSTACSSSAKVFAQASRYIQAGLIDSAVVGGVDSLCLTTLYGFNSLQLVAKNPCRPWGEAREGVSIGEGGGFAIVERDGGDGGAVNMRGYGETSDGHHMSSPAPDGGGAALAIRRALQRAGIDPAEVGYINLHGTGTPANDAAEDRAVTGLFGETTPCSSTKGFTGHTLGAAGITESLFCCMALEEGLLPGSPTTDRIDSALKAHFITANQTADIRYAVNTSLGFGGSNASLVFGRTA